MCYLEVYHGFLLELSSLVIARPPLFTFSHKKLKIYFYLPCILLIHKKIIEVITVTQTVLSMVYCLSNFLIY